VTTESLDPSTIPLRRPTCSALAYGGRGALLGGWRWGSVQVLLDGNRGPDPLAQQSGHLHDPLPAGGERADRVADPDRMRWFHPDPVHADVASTAGVRGCRPRRI